MGNMGCGKSFCADILVEDHGFTKVSLASPVKQIAVQGRAILDNGAIPDNGRDFLLGMRLEGWADRLLPDGSVSTDPDVLDEARTALMNGWKEAIETSSTDRELYQRIGTDCGRAVDPNIWIRYFLKNLPSGNVVVDDVRFLNEAEALGNAGFFLVRLDPPAEARKRRLLERDGSVPAGAMGHASETEQELITCDTVYRNHSSPASARAYLAEVIYDLRAKERALPARNR